MGDVGFGGSRALASTESALPSKLDNGNERCHVRFRPNRDIVAPGLPLVLSRRPG
jgi:hypothetical protein